MPITLGTTPHSNWQALAPLLHALGCTTSEHTNPEHWYLAEQPRPEGLFLLAYTRPEQALATAMEEGTAPTGALQHWAEHAQALVALFKANRRQAVIIDASKARQHPEQAAAALASHWQLNAAPIVNTQSTPKPANPFYRLVAAAAVQQNKSITSLLAQLEACTLPLAEGEAEVGAESGSDADTLYAGLQTTQQQLDSAKQLKNNLQQTNNELRQTNAELQQTGAEHHKAHASTEEENQLLLEQLHLVQEELERHALAGKETEQAMVKLKKQLEQTETQAKEAGDKKTQAEQATVNIEQASLKKEQTAHTKINAEKATLESQLKALNTTSKDQTSQLEHLTEENQLMLEQLHLVQEELERHVLTGKDTEQAMVKLKKQLEQTKAQAKEAEDKKAQAEQATVNVEQSKQKEQQARTKAEQELKAVKAEQQALLKKHQAQEQDHKTAQASLKKEQIALTKINAEKATLESQLKALNTNNKNQTHQLENLTEENQLLLEQLHLVQEELENRFLQAQDQDQTLAAVKTKHEQAESQLHQTASQQAASQKEAELLQLRLHKLRDTLENLERSNRSLNGNLAEVKNQLAAAKKHQADWEHNCHQADRNGTLALAAANRRIAEISTELNKVTNTRTWKMTHSVASYSKKAKKEAAEKSEQQKAEIENSGLFDETWYLETYQDVADAGLNPIEHYLNTGAYEGRNPCDSFDTTWYLSHYRDVSESGLNPLVHYIRFGRKEERAPRPGALVSLPAPETPHSATQH